MLANLVDGDDVWVLKVGGGFGFPVEAPHVGLASQLAREYQFQRNCAVEIDLPGLEDDAHTAAGNFFEDLVIAEVTDAL
jgi:hypothetical protein